MTLNQRLKPAFESLERFADDPLVTLGVDDLTQTATILNPTFAALTPAQTVCNYLTLWFRNVASLLSEGDTNGTGQRFIIVATPQGPNNEGGPSSAPPANGPSTRTTTCTPTRTRTPPRPASRRSARRATRAYPSASRSSATCPGNQGDTTQTTTTSSEAERLMQPQARQAQARPAQGPDRGEPGHGRPARARRSRHRRLLRLHQARAVHARLPRQGRLRQRQLDPARTRRCASRASTSARSPRSRPTRPATATRRSSRWRSRQAGLPIHKDATLKIRPRIFLEGNFFVDLQPGTPSAPTIDDGDTIPSRRPRRRSSSTRC